ncbi:MAG: DUF5691 domain-containing protein [Saprospiraceae bacterium]
MSPRLEVLLKTALLGTARRPLTETEQLALGLDPSAIEPARTTLEALTTLFLRRKAGFLLADAPPGSPGPAAYDERPVCSPIAVRMLQQLLTGQYAPAQPEFTELLEKSGQRIPPEMLPELLHKGLDDRAVFQNLEPLLGPVGRWLAAQHFRWRSLLPDPAADWFRGGFDDRLRLLLAARRRSPLAGLAWLEATWDQESSTQQLKFLETLIHGLSDFDVPLLQRAARDKKEAVRQAALRLLDLRRLSPPEVLRLVMARQAADFPAGVEPASWPKVSRLALLGSPVLPGAQLAGQWPALLAQLAIQDRYTPVFAETSELARLIAYRGNLPDLEAAFPTSQLQLPPETGKDLAGILAFRRLLVRAFSTAPEAAEN